MKALNYTGCYINAIGNMYTICVSNSFSGTVLGTSNGQFSCNMKESPEVMVDKIISLIN